MRSTKQKGPNGQAHALVQLVSKAGSSTGRRCKVPSSSWRPIWPPQAAEASTAASMGAPQPEAREEL
eukprot:9740454-Prorocentrum_lima.AAC.1